MFTIIGSVNLKLGLILLCCFAYICQTSAKSIPEELLHDDFSQFTIDDSTIEFFDDAEPITNPNEISEQVR